MEHFLGFLGLAKKAGKLAVGEDPVYEAVTAGQVRLIFVASDAADKSRQRAANYAEEAGAFVLTLPADKKSLGAALGKNVCAMCAVTDIGFAAELARRLHALREDGETARAAERLALKKKRRDERQTLHKSGVKREKPGGEGREGKKAPSHRAEEKPTQCKPVSKGKHLDHKTRVSHEPPVSIPGRNREEQKGRGKPGAKTSGTRSSGTKTFGAKSPEAKESGRKTFGGRVSRGQKPKALPGKRNGMGQRKGRS